MIPLLQTKTADKDIREFLQVWPGPLPIFGWGLETRLPHTQALQAHFLFSHAERQEIHVAICRFVLFLTTMFSLVLTMYYQSVMWYVWSVTLEVILPSALTNFQMHLGSTTHLHHVGYHSTWQLPPIMAAYQLLFSRSNPCRIHQKRARRTVGLEWKEIVFDFTMGNLLVTAKGVKWKLKCLVCVAYLPALVVWKEISTSPQIKIWARWNRMQWCRNIFLVWYL